MTDIRTLNNTLREAAIRRGLCQQWQDMWRDSLDETRLISLFKRGIDFCIINNWPSVDFITASFDPVTLIAEGVFASIKDKRYENLTSDVYVVMGDSEITLSFLPYVAATVYIRHNSKVRIEAPDSARIQLRLSDNSSVDAPETKGQHGNRNISIIDRRPSRELAGPPPSS